MQIWRTIQVKLPMLLQIQHYSLFHFPFKIQRQLSPVHFYCIMKDCLRQLFGGNALHILVTEKERNVFTIHSQVRNVFLTAIIACFFNCVFKENFLGSTLFIWEKLLQILIFLLFFWGNLILTWSIAFFKYHSVFLHLPYKATKVNIKAWN